MDAKQLAKLLFETLQNAADQDQSGVPYSYNAFEDELEIGIDGEVDCKKFAVTIQAALNAAGFAILPKEPTPEMLAAGYGFCGEENGSDKPASDFYRAMIAAAK